MSRKIRILFTVSVLFNILLLGTYAGMMIKRWHDNPWHRAYSELAPETQNIVAREFQEARKGMRGPMQEFRRARKDLSRILQKEDLNEEQYEAALKRMHGAQQKMMERKIEMMKGLMAELPPSEREKLSHRLMRPFGKHHRKPHGLDPEARSKQPD